MSEFYWFAGIYQLSGPINRSDSGVGRLKQVKVLIVLGAAYRRPEYEAMALARGPEAGCCVFYHIISIHYF